MSVALPPPSFARRLMAMLYDAFLQVALLFIITGLTLAVRGGEAVPPNSGWYQGLLLLVSFLYFGWFWTHGGQTLGMRAWRVRVVTVFGDPITWTNALVRFCFAVCSLAVVGVGFLWALVDRQNRTWHDRWSDTQLVLLEKETKKKKPEETPEKTDTSAKEK